MSIKHHYYLHIQLYAQFNEYTFIASLITAFPEMFHQFVTISLGIVLLAVDEFPEDEIHKQTC